MRFFVWLNEKQVGPYEADQLYAMLANGELSMDTLCRPELGGDWTPITELSSLEASALEPNLASEPEPSASGTLDEKTRLELTLNSGEIILVSQLQLHDTAGFETKLPDDALNKEVKEWKSPDGSVHYSMVTSTKLVKKPGQLSNWLDSLASEQRIHTPSKFFPISAVQNINLPAPSAWRVAKTALVGTEVKTFPSGYSHIGDDFITIHTDVGEEISIRWSAVAKYRLRHH